MCKVLIERGQYTDLTPFNLHFKRMLCLSVDLGIVASSERIRLHLRGELPQGSVDVVGLGLAGQYCGGVQQEAVCSCKRCEDDGVGEHSRA